MPREPVLSGFTYKLVWPDSDHAMYVTINDTMDGDKRRPFEIFINSKNLEHYAWTVALTRMISAIFRRGGDVSFVVEELKAVFDPRGGAWMNGKYVPSLLAAIGGIIEQHFRHIGFWNGTGIASGAMLHVSLATFGRRRRRARMPEFALISRAHPLSAPDVDRQALFSRKAVWSAGIAAIPHVVSCFRPKASCRRMAAAAYCF